MGLFGFGKKKEETKAGCTCGGACHAHTKEEQTERAAVKVLGSGCAKCNALETATREALEQLGMDTTIEHVTDFTKIASYGVMTTPALVIREKVVSYGKVLKTDEVIKILERER